MLGSDDQRSYGSGDTNIVDPNFTFYLDDVNDDNEPVNQTLTNRDMVFMNIDLDSRERKNSNNENKAKRTSKSTNLNEVLVDYALDEKRQKKTADGRIVQIKDQNKFFNNMNQSKSKNDTSITCNKFTTDKPLQTRTRGTTSANLMTGLAFSNVHMTNPLSDSKTFNVLAQSGTSQKSQKKTNRFADLKPKLEERCGDRKKSDSVNGHYNISHGVNTSTLTPKNFVSSKGNNQQSLKNIHQKVMNPLQGLNPTLAHSNTSMGTENIIDNINMANTDPNYGDIWQRTSDEFYKTDAKLTRHTISYKIGQQNFKPAMEPHKIVENVNVFNNISIKNQYNIYSPTETSDNVLANSQSTNPKTRSRINSSEMNSSLN